MKLLEHEVVNRQKDGTLRHYEIRERTVDLPDGTRGILVVTNDITERKTAEDRRLELERSVLRAQKLESLGVLAGGIAHDFNNLLTIILGNLELAAKQDAGSPNLRDNLDAIAMAGKRAADLTRMMLAYSGRGTIHHETGQDRGADEGPAADDAVVVRAERQHRVPDDRRSTNHPGGFGAGNAGADESSWSMPSKPCRSGAAQSVYLSRVDISTQIRWR